MDSEATEERLIGLLELADRGGLRVQLEAVAQRLYVGVIDGRGAYGKMPISREWFRDQPLEALAMGVDWAMRAYADGRISRKEA